MSEATPIIESLYRNFVLRDLFAKMVPGFIVSAVWVYRFPQGSKVVDLAKDVGWPVILIGAGFVWVVGFAVQEFGERFGLIKHHPEEFSDGTLRYSLRIDFKKIASIDELQQAERYAVVKEASGNTSVAIIIAIFSSVIRNIMACSFGLSAIDFFDMLLMLSISALLIGASRSHATKQYSYMKAVVEKAKGSQA